MCIRPLTRCSLHATADIFALLKSNQDEPDPLAAQAAGLPLGTHALRFIVHYAWGRAVVVAVIVGKIRDFHQPVPICPLGASAAWRVCCHGLDQLCLPQPCFLHDELVFWVSQFAVDVPPCSLVYKLRARLENCQSQAHCYLLSHNHTANRGASPG
jgi:hypothetical protein